MSGALCVPDSPNPARSSRPLLRHLLLILLSVLLPVPPCLCGDDGPTVELHNVWYSGLFISGIAVDEASGDVYFSDAAGNRVVHQSENGTVVSIWDASDYGFSSPMQIVYHKDRLWLADSTNNRIGSLMDGLVVWLFTSNSLSSCSALTLHAPSHTLWVVDGWGLKLQPLNVSTSDWGEVVELWGDVGHR